MRRETISSLGELALLDDIRRRFARKCRDVRVGIGDDAAVITTPGESLLITTDMMVEGVHFDLRFITGYQLGFKLVSVNVSDIYAMGGTPRHLLLNIAVRGNTPQEFVRMLLNGIGDAMNHYGVILVGGDLSSAKGGVSLAATVTGTGRRFLLRAGARVGDGIYVTGRLGDSACGLHLLKKVGRTVPITFRASRNLRYPLPGMRVSGRVGSKRAGLQWETVEPLLRRHLLPEARNSAALRRAATAMIDVSDGLLIDLSRVCDESGVGARIFEEKIPISSRMKMAAKCLGLDPMTLALTGGEDYEILFTRRHGKETAATRIGEVTESERVIVSRTGDERIFSNEGYQHFSG